MDEPQVFIYYAKYVFLDFSIGLSKLLDQKGISNWVIDHQLVKNNGPLAWVLRTHKPVIAFYDTTFTPNIFFWNSEPLVLRVGDGTSFKGLELCRTIWDYSQTNKEIVEKFCPFHYIPFGYLEYFETCYQTRLQLIIPEYNFPENIDVLFYGIMNERRQYIIDQLRSKGINVYCPTEKATKSQEFITNQIRDKLISQSKIVLSIIKSTDDPTADLFRLNYLFSNKVFAICEENSDPVVAELKKIGVAYYPYDQLVDKCIYYLSRPDERKQIGQQVYHGFKENFNLKNLIPYNSLFAK